MSRPTITSTTRVLARLLLVLVALPATLRAEGGAWDTRFGPAPATNGVITCIAIDDAFVYVGGEFTVIDGVPAAHVARWDPTARQWSSMGAGVNGDVHDIIVASGQLFVAGTFTRADSIAARGVARYDPGSGRWSSLGDPSVFASGVPPRGFYCLLDVGDDIYAAGNLTLQNDQRSYGIFRWSPLTARWSHVANGIDSFGNIYAMASLGGSIAIGGNFRSVGRPGTPAGNIALLNVSTGEWVPVAQGVRGTVRALLSVDSVLWVGGSFDTAYGRSTNLSRWDYHAGSAKWLKAGEGAGNSTRGVSALAYDGRLIHVGLRQYGATDQPALVTVDPLTLVIAPAASLPNADVRDVAVSDGTLHIVGSFTFVGSLPYRGIAVRDVDSAAWRTFASHLYIAPTGPVLALTAAGNGGAVVGGTFQWVGFEVANNVAIWDGARWEPLGAGVNGTVRAIAVDGDSIYVGGDFTTAGGVAAPYIARFDRTTRTWSSLGDAFDGPVHAIVVGPGHSIFAGGSFTHVGAMLARGVSLWNTRWWALGVGPTNGVDGEVRAMAMIDRFLYVGGTFVSAGGNPEISHLARWDLDNPGWSAIGDGVDNSVTVIHSTGGSLIVGGPIGRAGSVVARGIARWDGSEWSALGAGLHGPRSVYGITEHGRNLVATGGFDASGPDSVKGLAMFDGTRWVEIGAGIGAAGASVMSAGGNLYVGGEFRTVGAEIPSQFLGVWLGAATIGDRDEGVTAMDLVSVRPNPLVDVATLELQLHRGANVRITLVDALGRVRSRPESGRLSAGRHLIPLSLGLLPRGVYLLNVDVGTASESTRIFLR